MRLYVAVVLVFLPSSGSALASAAADERDVLQMRETPSWVCGVDYECGHCEVCQDWGCVWRPGGECYVPKGNEQATTCGSFGMCVLDEEACEGHCVFDPPPTAKACQTQADCPPCVRCEFGFCDHTVVGCCADDADCGQGLHCGTPSRRTDAFPSCSECFDDADCPLCFHCPTPGVSGCRPDRVGECDPWVEPDSDDWEEGCGRFGTCAMDEATCLTRCDIDTVAAVAAGAIPCRSWEDCPLCNHCNWGFCEITPEDCCLSDDECPSDQYCVPAYWGPYYAQEMGYLATWCASCGDHGHCPNGEICYKDFCAPESTDDPINTDLDTVAPPASDPDAVAPPAAAPDSNAHAPSGGFCGVAWSHPEGSETAVWLVLFAAFVPLARSRRLASQR